MSEKILLAEDDDALRTMIQMILEMEGYEVQAAENGLMAYEQFALSPPDLVISDIGMPEMDGFALLEAVRNHRQGQGTPFLFLSAYSQPENISRARLLGMDDYLFKPFDMQDLLDAVYLRLSRRQAIALLDTREAHLQTVTMLANVIEARDAYTRGHVARVRSYALVLGRALNWDETSLLMLEFGAILHDVGKIVVPDSVLNKPTSLAADELAIMHRHAEAGAKILDGVTHLQAALPYILYHHERWDGEGYPCGLAEESIPLEGRLLTIVDAYDAMTTDRPYRTATSRSEALEEIKKRSGRQFDPVIVDTFLELMA